MDAGMALKPVVSVVNTHAQPAIAIVPPGPTELVAAKAVAPVENTAPARNEPRPTQANTDTTTRFAFIDPQTNEVVYRILDARTRQVLHQVPDQAMLRMQAYARAQTARELAQGKNPTAAEQSDMDDINTLA
jgi:hypothetical protein